MNRAYVTYQDKTVIRYHEDLGHRSTAPVIAALVLSTCRPILCHQAENRPDGSISQLSIGHPFRGRLLTSTVRFNDRGWSCYPLVHLHWIYAGYSRRFRWYLIAQWSPAIFPSSSAEDRRKGKQNQPCRIVDCAVKSILRPWRAHRNSCRML
jgi:hypothetical protein